MDQIEDVLNSQNPQVGDLAAKARRVVLATVPDALAEKALPEENAVQFLIETAGGQTPFAWVGLFPDHVTLGFYEGAKLPDPAGLLKGEGSARRIDFTEDKVLEDPAVRELIQAAFRGMF